jgi:hypothetical protein
VVNEAKEWWNKIMLTQLLLTVFLYTSTSKFMFQILMPRDSFAIVGFTFLVLALGFKKPLFFFITGLFSAFTYAYSIDRGAYFSALILIIPMCFLFFPLVRDFKLLGKFIFFLFSGIFIGWCAFILVFGFDEFTHFLQNTLLFYRTKDLFDSYIYPRPGFNKHTAPMVMIGIQIYGFLVYFLKKYRFGYSNRHICYIHLSFVVLSVFYFRSSLGRSDLSHVYYGSSFAFLGVGLLIWLIIKMIKNKYIFLIVIIALFSLNAFIIYKRLLPEVNFDKISSFKVRVANFMQLDDSEFLNPNERSAILRMEEIFKEEKCFFSFTSEAAMPYLLKKTSCGKNFIVWFCSPRPKRDEIMSDLIRCSPKYILFKSKHWTNAIDRIDNAKRFDDVYNFIISRYAPFETINNDWEVYRRK